MSCSPKADVSGEIAELARSVRRRDAERKAWKHLWLSHHWPDEYGDKCFAVGSHHVCRRCSALYPVGVIAALASLAGFPLWPDSVDPTAIWVLCVPASVAFVGEKLRLFDYSARWQFWAQVAAATAFGKALGYELVDRWSLEFWAPVTVFGGLWFCAARVSGRP